MKVLLFECSGCQFIQTHKGPCVRCGLLVFPLVAQGVNKYNAQLTEVDGIKFASRSEAKRWGELRLFEQHGTISNLRRQVPYALHAPGGGVVTKYVADFVYEEGGLVVVEDRKGVRTQLYKIKRKWLLLEYGIQIRET